MVDNLETVADYTALLPALREWGGKSTFLMTSRRRMLDQPDVASVSLRELSEQAGLELIRHEGSRVGVPEIAVASDDDLMHIYAAVGGNPLALKVLVGQLQFYSLPDILERYQQSSPESSGGLFDYVFMEAWSSTDDDGKGILLSLMDAGETGFTFRHLRDVAEMSDEQLTKSLEQLILVSLVDVTGNLFEKRYRLHRLTEAFLHRLLE